MTDAFRQEARRVMDADIGLLYRAGCLQPGDLVVLGCSTSEIAGARIGQGSVPEMGEIVVGAFLDALRARGLHGAVQCCEHLNRALVMEKDVLLSRGLLQVHAVPQPKAGGSAAAACWRLLRRPALAQSVQAEAAMDIGDTLVGMHIRPVAVPLRPSCPTLGSARVVMAYARWPLIGGERAVYHEEAE